MKYSIKNLFEYWQKTPIAALCAMCLLVMAVVASGCNRKNPDNPDNPDGPDDPDTFCTFVSVESMDKTIPFVDVFLSGLSDDLVDEQKLQAVAAWFKSQPCIIDAAVFCVSCAEANPSVSEISFSFDENGETKEMILELSMTNPMKVSGYREYEEPEKDFCSFVSVENIGKTLPFVNEFLAGLSDDLSDEQKLHALAAWFKSQPCIIDADVVCLSCLKMRRISEIAFSFDENGETKEMILDVQMTNPLKVETYHDKPPEEAEYPVEIPFTEYSLAGTSCKWINRFDIESYYGINNNEELKTIISCPDGIYPEIDFTKHTLVVPMGYTFFGVSKISKKFQQISSLAYQLDFGITLNDEQVADNWSFAILTKKMCEGSNVRLYYRDEGISLLSLPGTKWNLVKVVFVVPSHTRYYSDIVYDFDTNGVLTVTGETGHYDWYGGHDIGEHPYSITNIENVYGFFTLRIGRTLNPEHYYSYICRISSKELILDGTPFNGYYFHLVKINQ